MSEDDALRWMQYCDRMHASNMSEIRAIEARVSASASLLKTATDDWIATRRALALSPGAGGTDE